jgi:hypothetical protein
LSETDLFNELVFGEEKDASQFADALNSPTEAVGPDGLIDTFVAGVRSGAKGLSADLEYFKAGAQTLVGDEKGAAESVKDARALEQLAALPMEQIETFGEFLENPTFDGFLTQVASGTGQVLPSAITSIGSAGAGAVAAVGLRTASGQTAKHLSKRLIQEAAEATANGTADATQKRIAQGGYEALREAYAKRKRGDLTKGALTGAGAAEFAPLTGSNINEALEAGEELDRGTVLRAGAVALPQATVGVLGEVGLASMLKSMATKKAGSKNSIWAQYAKDFSLGGATEGTAEVVQEGIAIANRQDLDPTYEDADAKLRLQQAAFTGFFAGGAIGGAGSVVSSAVQSDLIQNAPDKAAEVVDKSAQMMDKLKEMVTSRAVVDDVVGDVDAGQTTPESDRDITAQVDAMLDETSSKEAVWIAGTEPDKRFAVRRGKVKPITVNGEEAYSVFVPGRGTLVSKTYDLAEEVLAGSASDAVLAAALGYSSVKSVNDSVVVRAYDKQNDIVSEQSTTPEGLAEAVSAAEKLAPEGGRVEQLTPEEAQIDRQQRDKPDVQFMDEIDPLEESDVETDVSSEFEPEVRTYTFNRGGETTSSYKASDDDSFAGIDPARTEYEAVFGETEWSTPFYKRMSESLLKTATKLQQTNPDEVVGVKINTDGSYRIDIETTPDTVKVRLKDPITKEESEVSVGEFLERSVAQAAKSKFRNVNVKAPGSDKFTSVNLVDLTNAGRRLNEANTGSFTEGGDVNSQRQGLLAMLGQLAMAEYEVEIQGVPIEVLLENIQNPTKELPAGFDKITAGFNNKKPLTLDTLLKPYVPGKSSENTMEVDVPSEPQVRQETILNEVDGTEIGREPTDPDSTQTDLFAGLQEDVTVIEYPDEKQTEEVSVEEAMERRQDADPITDTVEIAENSARTFDGSPLTRMNIEEVRDGVNTAQARPRGGAPSTGPARPAPEVVFDSAVTFPFGMGNKFLGEVAQRLQRAVRFTQPIAVVSIKEFDAALRKDMRSLVLRKTSGSGAKALLQLKTLDLGDTAAVGAWVQSLASSKILSKRAADWVATQTDAAAIGEDIVMGSAFTVVKPFTTDLKVAREVGNHLRQSLPANNTRRGSHKAYKGGSIITIDDLHNKNQAGLAMVLAHEFGHALYRQDIDALLTNKALYGRMWKAFEADRKKANDEGQPVKQWNEVGFEEWYADQVAAWTKASMEQSAKSKRKSRGIIDAHFRKLVGEFRKLYKALRNHPIVRRTGKVDESFSEYMDEVTQRQQAVNVELPTGAVRTADGKVTYRTALGSIDLNIPAEVPFEQKATAQAVREEIDTIVGTKQAAAKWARFFRGLGKNFARKHPSLMESLKFVLSADTVLRLIDPTDTIADMFYMPSNTKAGLGFVKARQLARDKMRAELFDIIGTDWDNEVTQRILAEAESGRNTSGLTPKAQELRKFLERIHADYISQSNTNIKFVKNYYPRILDLAEVTANPEPLIQEILRMEPEANEKKVRQSLKRLEAYQEAILDDEGEIDIKPEDVFEPARTAESGLKLTAAIPPNRLRQLGYVLPPEVALLSYIDRVTKRVEWNRHTKREDGSSKLEDAMAKLNSREKEILLSITNAYLGNITPMEPFWRKMNSYAQLVQTVTILPFAFFASIPDFAGAVVNTREFNGFNMFGKQVMSMIKDKAEAERLANDIGVTMSEAAATAWMSQADGELLDPTVREATEKYFKYIGLDFLTTLSRQFASGMGRQFLLEHANHPGKRSERYLKQLGVTAEQVKAWEASGFDLETKEGKLVKEALVRFVESSVLRPNAAERPIWASDPRFALIWQLKSFLYSFNKTILGGLEREFMTRLAEDRNLITALVPVMLLTAAAFLPLAALGLELREYAKVALSYAIPGIDGSTKYLRSDRMDWGTYMTEIWDRAGLNGPISLLYSAQRSQQWGNSGIATLLGPTAESIEKIIGDFPRFDTPITDRITQPAGAVGAAAGVAAFGPQIAKAIL